MTNLAGADTSCQTIVISGIETNNAASQVTLYPNPTNRILNMMWSNAVQGEAKVELSNALGAKVLSFTSPAQGIEKIDMSSYSPGVYFVAITNGSTTSVSKFVYTK